MRLKFYFVLMAVAISTMGKAQNNCLNLGYDAAASGNRCDYITIGDIETTNGLDNFTMEYWISCKKVTYGPSFGHSGSSGDGIRFMMTNSGNAKLWSGTSATTYVREINNDPDLSIRQKFLDTFVDDQWIHVALTFESTGVVGSGTAKLYLNGELFYTYADYTTNDAGDVVKNIVCMNPASNGFTDFNIGGNGTVTRRLEGKLDEFRIWNTARTQQEIKDNMNQELDATQQASSNLVIYYNFNNDAGTTIQDVSTGTTTYNGTIIPMVGGTSVDNFIASDVFTSTSIGSDTKSNSPSTVYVNNGMVTVEPLATTSYEVAIYNSTGQIVKNSSGISGTYTTALPSRGLYIVVVKQTGNKPSTTKIIY